MRTAPTPTARFAPQQKLLQQSPRIEGHIDQPNERERVLMQPAGRQWDYFHEVILHWLGAIVILGMIVALGAALVPLVLVVDPQILQSGPPFVLPYVTSLGPAGAVAAAVACSIAGLAVVFWGQVASALFDQANATRELVAIERAKQAGDQD